MTVIADTARVATVALSSDQRLAALGDEAGRVAVMTLAALPMKRRWRAHAGPVVGLAFGPDGTTLASVGQEGTVTVWDADAGRMRQTALLRPPPRRPLAVDGSRLQLASAQDGIVVEDPFGKGPRRELHGGFLCRLARSWRRLAPGARPAADALAFRPDGGLLATACGSGIALWDVGEGALIGTLRGHEGSVSDLAFSADGKSLVSGSQEDGTIRVWDVRSFAR